MAYLVKVDLCLVIIRCGTSIHRNCDPFAF